MSKDKVESRTVYKYGQLQWFADFLRANHVREEMVEKAIGELNTRKYITAYEAAEAARPSVPAQGQGLDWKMEVDLDGTLKVWPPIGWRAGDFAEYINRALAASRSEAQPPFSVCPICEFVPAKPFEDHSICPQCKIEFGYEDCSVGHAYLKRLWKKWAGAPAASAERLQFAQDLTMAGLGYLIGYCTAGSINNHDAGFVKAKAEAVERVFKAALAGTDTDVAKEPK